MMTTIKSPIRKSAMDLVLQNQVQRGCLTVTDGWNWLRFLLSIALTAAAAILVCVSAPEAPVGNNSATTVVMASALSIAFAGTYMMVKWMEHSNNRACAAWLSRRLAASQG